MNQNLAGPAGWMWCGWARTRPAHRQHYYYYWKVSTFSQVAVSDYLMVLCCIQEPLTISLMARSEAVKVTVDCAKTHPNECLSNLLYFPYKQVGGKSNERLLSTEMRKCKILSSSYCSSPRLHHLSHSKANIATDSNP